MVLFHSSAGLNNVDPRTMSGKSKQETFHIIWAEELMHSLVEHVHLAGTEEEDSTY